MLGSGVVPPNNQGNATPFYNQGDNGENPAKDGVATVTSSIATRSSRSPTLDDGYIAFAGQRDDGFYADIQAIFDLLKLRNPGKDSQGGFNLHLMALAIPIDELGGDQQIAGVYATTSRERFTDSARRTRRSRSRSATGCRSRVRATRCSTKASSRSRTRTSTAARRPAVDAALFASTRRTRSSRSCSTCSSSSPTSGHRDRPHRHRRHLHPRRDQGGPLDRRRRASPAAAPTIRPIRTMPASRGSSIFGDDVLISTDSARLRQRHRSPAAGRTAGASATTSWTSR